MEKIKKENDICRMSVKKKINWKHAIPIYIMVLPGVLYLIINNYIPMFGVIIAFKKLNFSKGIFGSEWCGFKNFEFLFATKDAWTITRNMIGYLTYAFLSGETGLINKAILQPLGMQTVNFYQDTRYWPFILVLVNTWKAVGYNMIIYYSSIVGISSDYYEAARIDGASKWQQIKSITLLLKPTIITLLILAIGQVFRSDFGLFYQIPRNSGPLYPVTCTLDVYVYQALMLNSDYGMSSAASLYQSVVGFILIVAANFAVRKYNKDSTLF